jgi:hypothetical protein
MTSAGGTSLWWLASSPQVLLRLRFVSFLIAPHRGHKTFFTAHVLTCLLKHDRSPPTDNS